MSSEPHSPILRLQNSPPMVALLHAMSVSHRRAQRLDALSTTVSIAVAALGPVGAFVESAAGAIAVVGALWALVYSTGLATWTGRELERAAVLQEMFDARLFAIPWNHVLAEEPLAASEISRLSKRYNGRSDMITNYYEIPDLPRPFDIFACQQQNLGWGARVRRRYAYSVLTVVCGWCVLGVVIGGLANLTVGALVLSFYVPSLGALMLGLDIFRSQQEVATIRRRVLRQLRFAIVAYLRESGASVPVGPDRRVTAPTSPAELLVLARQVQDALYLTRRRTPRVPDWYFLRFRLSDRIDFRASMDELDRLLRRSTPAAPVEAAPAAPVEVAPEAELA